MAITLWNPQTEQFEAAGGPASENFSSETLLINILLEMRVQTRLLFAIGADVTKETTENVMRLDAANELPNFVNGSPITNNL